MTDINDDPEYEKFVYWNEDGAHAYHEMSKEARSAFEKLIDLHQLVEPLNREMEIYTSIIEGDLNE